MTSFPIRPTKRGTTMRTLITSVAVGLALVAAVPATASARNARPSPAQATPVAQRLAEQAAAGLRTFGILEVEHISVSCGRPLGWGPRSLTCVYALYVHNNADGTGQTCFNSVYVFKAPKTGRLSGRFGSQNCF
jgi:hypothetical protein